MPRPLFHHDVTLTKIPLINVTIRKEDHKIVSYIKIVFKFNCFNASIDDKICDAATWSVI